MVNRRFIPITDVKREIEGDKLCHLQNIENDDQLLNCIELNLFNQLEVHK